MSRQEEPVPPNDEEEEAPETPTDEPKPMPVQDPPSEPDQHPYVVRMADRRASSRVRINHE